METNRTARAVLPRRFSARLGFWLALALWALQIIAGTAAALAADTSSHSSGDTPLVAAVQGSGDSAPGVTIPPPATAVSNATPPSSASAAPGQGDAVGPSQPGTSNDPHELESVLGPEPPTRVRVAILNATGKTGGANKVAVLLGEYKRQTLEDQIGMQIEVVNLSTAEGIRTGQSVLFYRPEFLRAALAMAKAIPGDQRVEPMRPAGLKRAGVDIEIVVGQELP